LESALHVWYVETVRKTEREQEKRENALESDEYALMCVCVCVCVRAHASV